jgi:hypothetical protein
MPLHRFDECLRATVRDGGAYRAADETNLFMPKVLEMFYRLIHPGCVVDEYITQSRAGDTAVHGYEGDTVALETPASYAISRMSIVQSPG